MTTQAEKEREKEREQTQGERTTRPTGAAGPGVRGAEVEGMSATVGQPNEVDDGEGGARIPPARPIPPGEDQPGLVGGGGIEGSGNVEGEPYPPDAATYPPLRDESVDEAARLGKRGERDKAVEDDRVKRVAAAEANESPQDRVAETLEEKKELVEASRKASDERDKRIEDERSRIREGSDNRNAGRKEPHRANAPRK